MTFQPFPTDALPQPVRRFVRTGAQAVGCDPSYFALPMLTALAAAIGNTRRIELKRGWAAPPILWTAVVGESGTAKTPAFRIVMRPIRQREQRALAQHAEALADYRQQLVRHEAELAAWKRDRLAGEPPLAPGEPQAQRSIVSDATVEALAPILLANPRGLLLACDELAGWLGSFDRYSSGKGKDAAHWLSMHAGDSIVVDRKTGEPRTIFVPQAAVCVTGGIQPGTLRRALGIEHRESGLAARLLLSCPPRTAKRWTEAEIDLQTEADIARLFDRLYELEPLSDDNGQGRPAMVELTSDAKALWTNYYDGHGQEQVELEGDLAAAWSKLEEYAARLALVIHLTRWAAADRTLKTSEAADAASVSAGIRLAQWFKGEARRVYGRLEETDDESARRRLAEWIDLRGGDASAREVQKGCRWLSAPGAAERALIDLVRAGEGVWEPTPPGQVGQPTRRFRLSARRRVGSRRYSPRTSDLTGFRRPMARGRR